MANGSSPRAATPTDAVIAKKMDHGGPVADIVRVPPTAARDQPHGGLGLPPVATVLESRTASTSISRAALAARRISFRVAPTGGAVEQVTTGERRLTAFSYDRAITKMAYQVGTLRGAVGHLGSRTSTASGERQLTHVHDASWAKLR